VRSGPLSPISARRALTSLQILTLEAMDMESCADFSALTAYFHAQGVCCLSAVSIRGCGECILLSLDFPS